MATAYGAKWERLAAALLEDLNHEDVTIEELMQIVKGSIGAAGHDPVAIGHTDEGKLTGQSTSSPPADVPSLPSALVSLEDARQLEEIRRLTLDGALDRFKRHERQAARSNRKKRPGRSGDTTGDHSQIVRTPRRRKG
jgi:hypothetical protein